MKSSAHGPLLVAQGLVKTYPGTRALDGADFTLDDHEIHAVVGSNGAGKSTLVKVISGRERPDEGQLWVAGTQVDHGAANYLSTYSIGYVSQEGSLDPEMTASENVFLGCERTRGGLVSYRRMQKDAQALADEHDFKIDVSRRVGDLSPSQRKVVEILRALALRPRVLILDEPTAALPKPDIDHLLEVMRGLTAHTSIIFISHYMDEIFRVSDRVSVMRDGRRVSDSPASATDADRLVAEMLGDRALKAHQAAGRSNPVGQVAPEVRLEAVGLRTKDSKVEDGTIALRAGEISGLFGMVGAGKSELLEVIYGMRRAASGSLSVDGTPRPVRGWDVRRALSCGVSLVPEDRLRKALVASETSAWNLAAPHWRRAARKPFAQLGKLEKSLAKAAAELVTIRGDLNQQPVSTLSGGNKQKVSVCRWLLADDSPAVLLLDEPTQGLDVVAREEIYRLVRRLADEGAAVLLASSDLEEAATVSDRVFVMKAGRVLALSSDEQTRDQILLAATGDLNLERKTHV